MEQTLKFIEMILPLDNNARTDFAFFESLLLSAPKVNSEVTYCTSCKKTSVKKTIDFHKNILTKSTTHKPAVVRKKRSRNFLDWI
jgi:hypothetical protein